MWAANTGIRDVLDVVTQSQIRPLAPELAGKIGFQGKWGLIRMRAHRVAHGPKPRVGIRFLVTKFFILVESSIGQHSLQLYLEAATVEDNRGLLSPGKTIK